MTRTRILALPLAFAALIVLAGCDPVDRRPGTWLSGEVETAPVTDWSFANEPREIFVETRTWYGIPHSVTTVVVAHNGTLYVPSVYFEGGEFPDARYWNRNVARDPRVRLKIGDRIYERQAALVEDPAEWNDVLVAFARKNPFWQELASKPESERPKVVFLRMDPRDPV